MDTRRDPRELAETILMRSQARVQVGAVIADRWGVYSWAWNHMGFDGFGAHAEAEAIRRSNRRRLKGSTIYVAGRWRHSLKLVEAKPCLDCQPLLRGLTVVYRDAQGVWRTLQY